uniref:Uncharacterized protein n=1 Tax=viral metagenome TaxID=1070528 RepID=A0A6C0AIK1_9ZZZZ
MATIGHKFKKALMSYDASTQRDILGNAKTQAWKMPDETAFYYWIQQIYFARINTSDDAEFANNTLWAEMNNHLNSAAFQTIAATL